MIPSGHAPALACRGPYDRRWASTQPLLELLVAGRLGSRREIRRLVAQRGLALQWCAGPREPETAAVLAGHRANGLLARYCEDAGRQLRARALGVWLPVTELDLATKTPYPPGVLVVRSGETLTRIVLADTAATERSI